jgi:hypothetical protein
MQALSGEQARPRTPAFVQIGLAVGIAVLLAAVTLTTRQPPPPAIAEFAPQAVEQIKETPKEQASEFGSGAGLGDCPPGSKCAAGDGAGIGGAGGVGKGDGGPAATTTTVPKPPPPSTKRCVGEPPRQIEDPQSPPCIPYWDDAKGNGGKTSFGVSKDEIIVAAPDQGTGNMYVAFANFFNSRFQLYGRKIKIVNPQNTGTAGADAAKELGAFAALVSYSDPPYYRELVHNKTIGFYRTTDFTDTELANAAPYLWGYTMSYTQILSNLGDWACHRLVGQKATHAGPPLSSADRSFGIFLQRATNESTVTDAVLTSALQQCGAKVPLVSIYDLNSDPVRYRNEIADAKAKGITDLFCFCRTDNLTTLQELAETNDYRPEWIITSYPQLVYGDPRNGRQMGRTIGVSFEPMIRTPEDHPQIWAMREGDPTNVNGSVRTTLVDSNDIHYRGFLALASGLQMAGPNLTPETFRAGLQRTRFPNPDHPIMAGKVGFEGDFSMTNDGAEFWYSETDQGPYDEQRRGPTFCWVDGGRRHAKGTWPTGGDPYFKGPCEAGTKSVA